MADLNSLIKYRKHLIDEKQKVLSQLYRDAEKIEQSKQLILAQMEREKSLADEMGMTEAHAQLGRYLEGARKKVRALDLSLKKMETRIDSAREDVQSAFAEMKKVQITQDRRLDREAAVAQGKEDRDLDEMGLDRFRRGE